MEDCPYGRALPSGSVFARRRLLRIESTRDLAKTQILNGVHLVDLFYYLRFSVKHLIKRRSVLGLTNIQIPIGRTTEYAHFAGFGAMPLTTPISLQDLRPLVLGDHALELHEQLILRARALRRVDKHGFHSMLGKLFNQQDLVCVFAAQSIR